MTTSVRVTQTSRQMPVCLCVCAVYLCVCLSVCLTVCLSVCTRVCLSVCLSLTHTHLPGCRTPFLKALREGGKEAQLWGRPCEPSAVTPPRISTHLYSPLPVCLSV